MEALDFKTHNEKLGLLTPNQKFNPQIYGPCLEHRHHELACHFFSHSVILQSLEVPCSVWDYMC